MTSGAANRRTDSRRTRSSLVASLLFVFAQALFAAGLAGAAPNDQAKLAIHLLGRTTKNACTRSNATPPCSGIITRGNLYPSFYFAYLLVTDGDVAAGVSGIQCGLSYDAATTSGVDIFTWNLCASYEFPTAGWPAAGTGDLITWASDTRCQRYEPGGAGTGVVAAAGYFYMAAYSPDVLQLTVRPADGQARVADCSNVESIIEGGGVHTVPSPLGAAGFSVGGIAPGYNPCDPGAVGIDCEIYGPDNILAGATGLVYSAPNAPAEAAFAWSLSGGGTIVGSTTGPTVSVNAVTPGNLTLNVVVTSDGHVGNCSRTVRVVTPPPTCSIVGPNNVNARTANLTFDLDSDVLPPNIEWSITGNGSITSNVHSSRITVTSGEAGAFELTATVHSDTSPVAGVCRKTVTVIEPVLDCTIAGPTSVTSGQPGIAFSVSPTLGELTAVAWTISGNGTLTSAANLSSVTVQAGAEGAFELQATVTSNASHLPVTCRKSVTVNASAPVSCSISGPLTLPANATGFDYTVAASGPITSVTWSISGNGTIPAGVHGSTITVSSGASGGFELAADVHTSNSYETGHCTLSVTISDAAPTCGITGPTSVLTGATNLSYDVAVAGGTVTGVHWTISGNGAITSNPNLTPVYVTATAAGAFELTATAQSTASPLPAVCRQVVTVADAPPPGCQIDGPTTVTEGTADVTYTLWPLVTYDTVEWTLTGDGSITSSPTAPVIHVQTGNPGTLLLTATLHGPGGATFACSISINVTYLTCLIQGPASVVESSTPVTYSSGPAILGASYQWHVPSGWQIVGSSTDPAVSVRLAIAGSPTITLTITRNGFPLSCSRTIQVTRASSNGTNGNARILVHLSSVTSKNACQQGLVACNQVVTAGQLLPRAYYAYLVVADGSGGIGGVQCGITYDAATNAGVDVWSWTVCGSLEFRSAGPNGLWPAAGSGNLITWDAAHCQTGQPGGVGTGTVAVAGYFYCGAYSSDVLRVIPRPVDGQAKVADCVGQESLIGGVGFPTTVPSRLGFAQFTQGGSVNGYNPCGVALPVKVTTWSAIKGMYH